MPSKTKMRNAAIAAKSAALPKVPKELLDQLVGDAAPMTAEQINATTMALKKALIERALGGELTHHLGYPVGAAKPDEVGNQRNGASAKTIRTDDGPLRIEVPRDREGSFEPILIPKHERRFTGFDDKIVAMYARGMTMREIQGFLLDQYGTEVSAEFISSVTDAVMAEVVAWQSRALEPMYPVVFFDALRVKIREDARSQRHPDRRHRWLEGHARGAGRRVPGHDAADVHRAPDAQQPGLRELEGPQGAGGCDQADLYGAERRGGAGRTRCLRARPVGSEVPHRRGGLAPRLGSRDPVLRVPASGAPRDLHHQRDREHQRAVAQDHQVARALPQ